jgi:hypothetical protein
MAKKDKRTALQKIGGHTLLPYALESAGYSKAATTTGYPRHLAEEEKDRANKKKKKKKSDSDAEGFSRGGMVQGTKFKGTF